MENVIFVDKALYFIQKARVQCQNRKTHLEKNDKQDPLVEDVLEKLMGLEKYLNKKVEEIVKQHPAYDWFSNIRGIGNLNIGKVFCLIDIEKATTISKLWRYALGAPINGKVEKREKGKPIHYNAMLKTMCWRLAKSLIRANGKYAIYYREQKKRITEKMEQAGYTIISGSEKGKEKVISKGHIDRMAMRKMLKLFLSHLWLKWREALGLPITKPYVHEIGGHTSYITPEEMMEAKRTKKNQ